MLLLWLLAVAAVAVVGSFLPENKMKQILSAGDQDTLQVEISTTTGAMTILVDNEPWLLAGDSPLSVNGWPDLFVLSVNTTDGDDQMYGPFRCTTLVWGSSAKSNDPLIETSVIAYSKRELVVFEQHWPKGWSPPTTLPNSDDSNSTILAAFPSLGTSSPAGLRFLTWGGCQVADPRSGPWDGTANSKNLFDGATSGEPLLLHKGSAGKTRALVLSSKEHFFVSGQAASPDGTSIDCGIRSTVHSLPKGFSHSSVLVAGRGINGTMMDWGDVLLSTSGKQRTDPYSDFVLGHLGYWTDNGAYYYMGVHTNYSNSEEALKAVKADLAKRRVPIRYMQWDDWWMESKGDRPGITSWTPKKSVFPSGFTAWLDLPLSLYAPQYSSENDWTDRYHFKNDPNGNPTAIPIDPAFYQDLFHNGTKIGMKMFEQDFLCSINDGTGLTNTDIDTGKLWMEHMDMAAIQTGATLQFCMMNPCHALHSTLLKSMTNGRATGDNTRDYNSITPMGQTGLLFYSLGFFPSRDNVWTTNSDVEQPSCANAKYCYEPNAHADNVVAVLGGGPYGPADAVGFTNRTLVMYACREDGVMLRPRWPLSSLDFTFTDPDAIDTLVWAAHDDFGPLRWSYIVGINLDRDVAITSERLQGISSGPMVAWKVEVGVPVTGVIPFSDRHGPLYLPAGPSVPKGPTLSHWAAAPVLPNGMALLGEVGKWTTMSGRRVISLEADSSAVTAVLFGAPGEKTVFAYAPASLSVVSQVECDFGASTDCDRTDVHGNTDCVLELSCTAQQCSCGPTAYFFVHNEVLLRGSFRREKE